MLFDWDPAKAASNELKHGVSFAEAVTVLDGTMPCMSRTRGTL